MSKTRPGLSRRDLLKGALAFGAGAALLPEARFLSGTSGLARAAALAPGIGRPARHYVFCYFSGGWDILLGLDPRNPAIFTNGNAPTTRIQPGYELVTTSSRPVVEALDGQMMLGPFMGELVRHADKMTIVRGVNMDTLTHEVGRRRFLTGRPPSGLKARGSSTDAWFAGAFGGDEAVPNLAIGVESYNTGDQPNFATALFAQGVDDLLRVLGTSGEALPQAVEGQIDTLLARAATCPEASGSALWRTAESSRKKARQMVEARLDTLFDLRANTPAMATLRARYGINNNTTELTTGKARAALAATAIMNGVSRSVSFTPTTGLDTHFDNWQLEHGPRLAEGMTAVARLIDHLLSTPYPDGSGDSWFDHTVILGFSEFSRTPLLNATGGRDHWLLNACFLAGGPVARGKVVGASSNLGMNPLPVDLANGRPCALDESLMVACTPEPGVTEVIRPEHILQALYHDLGFTHDEADLRVPALRAILRS